jgi:hypothetical protein
MSTFVSIVFLVLGAVAAGTMMLRLGNQSDNRLLLIVHRVAGWSFTVVLVLMTVVMFVRLSRVWGPLPSLTTLHFALAIALLLLLTMKLAIPRFFPGLVKHLFLFGVSAYLLAFTLVGISAGYFLVFKIWKIPYITHSDLANAELDAQLGKQFLISKCSTCHPVKDILIRNQSPAEWEKIVNRMVALAAPQITPGEAREIIYFLATEYGPRKQQEGRSH